MADATRSAAIRRLYKEGLTDQQIVDALEATEHRLTCSEDYKLTWIHNVLAGLR